MHMEDQSKTTGGRIWVSSVTGTNGTGRGLTPDAPCATLDYADTLCVANAFDHIYLMPGHVETIASAAASPTIGRIGVKVVGLGNGDDRPTFIFTHIDANIIVAATNVWLENILFINGIDNQVEMLDINFCDCTVKNCEFRADAVTQFATAIDINGGGANAADRPHLYDNKIVSETAGSVNGVEIGAVVDGAILVGNVISGDFSAAGIWSDQINTDALIKDNISRNIAAGQFAIEFTGATTGNCVGNRIQTNAVATALDPGSMMCNDNLWVGAIDQSGVPIPATAAAALPTGSIGAATIADAAIDKATFAADTLDLLTDGITVTRATGALPQTGNDILFTVSGYVLLKRILGVVTANVGAVGNVTHLRLDTTGAGATTDLCLAAGGNDITGDAAGTFYEITGTFANAMIATLDVPKAPSQATDLVLPPGNLEIACAGSDGGGGRVQWSVSYVPLTEGAFMVDVP